MKITQSIFLLFALVLSRIVLADPSVELKGPETIQILLVKNEPEALLEAKGAYNIFNPHDGSRVTSSLTGKRFMIRSSLSGIKWGEEYPGIHQILIVPKSNHCSFLVNGIQYDGAILVYKVGRKINIVNDVDIESYLKSTLTPKFPYPLESEVMASIAIAARTTAYYHVKKHKNSFWHISLDDVNYQGKAIIQPNSHVSSAIDRTKNLILVNSLEGENRPFAARWTENSAGKTAAFHDIFRKDWWAPKKGVDAPHAMLNRDETKWSYSISKIQLANLLNIKDINEINIFSDPRTAKAYAIRIKSSSNIQDMDFMTFQDLLGCENVLSNDLSINLKNSNVIFTGYGKGLGVGICIHSASRMAQNGESAVKILSKFFPDTFLLNLSAIVEKDKVR